MNEESLELIYGSGNVYRDFGDVNADLKQAKALLAAKIITLLEEENLSNNDTQIPTGIDPNELIRIHNAHLKEFTIDRLITILGQLNQRVEIQITTYPKKKRLFVNTSS